MPQFLIDPNQIDGNKATLSGDEAKHLVKVLRHKKGDRIWLSDGEHRYQAVIETIDPKEVVVKLLGSRTVKETNPSPILGIALLKHDHLELVIQKGVELGIGEFVLFTSERTIPHYHEAATPKKMERFAKIATEAAKQSGMLHHPKVHLPIFWASLVKKFDQFSGVLLAWEEEEESSFKTIFKTLDATRLLVIIGPEGGLASHEVAHAQKAGAKIISLGCQILRSETAAITTLTLCQYELGNI